MARVGKREGSGRKSKAVEQQLIEKLTPMNDDALKQLHGNIKLGEGWAIKMFMEYFYGKPTDHVDHTTDGDKIQNAPQQVIIKDYSKGK